ncbi:MAG: DUF1638 domain-containing protein [Actinobacteria bacterium]|nr:DUF1638 domain-containing protein [Actinomycetota bacterium]
MSSIERKLHECSNELREKIQEGINASRDFDIIFLGFGLCGKSIEGLISKDAVMVIPNCDDCIAILLGSVEEYKRQLRKEPGTYYLTRSYIGEADENIIGNVFLEIKEKFGKKKWKWIIEEMLKNYKRMVFINTGNYNPEKWRQIAIKEADKLNLKFEEIRSSGIFLNKIIKGDWDKDFIIVRPGQKVTFEMFLRNCKPI